MAASPMPMKSDGMTKLRPQYGCGPVELTGTDNALYERHLDFDNVLKVTAAGARERFEAFARSVRDVLSQRWVRTEETYDRENPKRIYYLSMEFLIGRSLANNIANLSIDLADLKSYLDADARLAELYADPDAWARKAILNVASAGKFSSDRTIAEYAASIWNAEPCPVS
jgi:starch phosphorylase